MAEKRYVLVFDKVMKKQLSNLDASVKSVLSKVFDKMEVLGPLAGELLDSKLHIYEAKMKRPPIRLYFRHLRGGNELQVFELEMKKSAKRQKKTISKLRKRLEP